VVSADRSVGALVAADQAHTYRGVQGNRSEQSAFLQQVQIYKYINIPMAWRRIPLTLAFELYYPELLTSGLAVRFQDRRQQLATEGERICGRMQALYDSLGGSGGAGFEM